MHTSKKQLIFLSLFAVVQLGNAAPTLQFMTVSQLMENINLTVEPELVKYFKELQLNDNCISPILDVTKFETIEINNPAPCLCTVIYNLTKELESSCLINLSNLEAAKNETNQFSKTKIYDYWLNAHKHMGSKNKHLFQQLMVPLNTTEIWSRVCYNLKKDLNPFCKFITVEIALFETTNIIEKPKETLKETVIISKNIKEPKNSTHEYEALTETNVVEPINNTINEEDDSQKEVDSNNKEQTDVLYNKDDEITDEELDKPVQEKPTDATKIVPTEFKNKIGTKENQILFNPKNTFKSHGTEEESHFFFYFGFMTVFSMIFYLVLYHKKKIIALSIEGRRSTNHRRRPNTASYSKVETDDGTTVY